MKTKRYALTCDLKDDPELIEKYKEHHKKIWP
ncbi:MAG TPA: L-rhamnose mutarotase, partial [Salinimicrobium sp.]|nr:L-rhamnose mutarotase [Salinimicrobium sp.]